MTGRPSTFTQDLADEICAQLSEGRSLRSVCLADDMPNARTVFRWLRTNEAFRQQYARAKEESADALVEEMSDIADGADDRAMQCIETIVELERLQVLGKGEVWTDAAERLLRKKLAIETPSKEEINRRRLAIDTRKWLASKLKPKKYGEKLDIDGKLDATVNVTVQKFSESGSAIDVRRIGGDGGEEE